MPRVLTPDDLFDLVLVGQVQGDLRDRLFYVEARLSRKENRQETRIMALSPGGEPVPFTQGPDDASPALSPQSDRLAFISKRSGTPQIWVMDLSGGEAHQVTRVGKGVTSYRWSPDGRSFAFLTQVEGEALGTEEDAQKDKGDEARHTSGVHMYSTLSYRLDGVGPFEAATPQVVWQDSLLGEPVLLTWGPYRVEDLAWSSDGKKIRIITHRSDDQEPSRGEIWEVETGGGALRPLMVDPHLSASDLFFVPGEGDRLGFTGSRPDALGYDNESIYLLQPGEAPLRLGASWDRSVGRSAVSDVVPPAGPLVIWPQGEEGPVALVLTEGTGQVAVFPASGAEPRFLTEGDHTISSFFPSPHGLVVCASTGTRPSDLYRVEGQSLAPLTDVNGDFLKEVAVAPVHRFTARADGGPEIDAWVLIPPGHLTGAKIPAVLEIHGGPMTQYTRSYTVEFQLIAAQGIAVIASNPRGSSGYGEAFCSAIREEWGKVDYEDLMAVVDEALRLFPALDSTRLGVAGGSYGGYMTNWIMGHTQRFKAAHTMRCVSDWRAMAGTSDVYWHWHKRAGAHPWEDSSFYRQQSPITYVEEMRTPVLIEHQEGDLRCPIEQAEILYGALKILGKAPAVFVRYPDEFHGMSRDGKPWHRHHRLSLIRAWWRHWLLGEAAEGPLKDHLN